MKKIKCFSATILSFGMVLTSSMTSYAAELPKQQSLELVLPNSTAGQLLPFTSYARITLDVKGNGVRLRKEPSTSAEIVGLLYENNGDWVTVSGKGIYKDGYYWEEVIDSSIGFSGWIADIYLKID